MWHNETLKKKVHEKEEQNTSQAQRMVEHVCQLAQSLQLPPVLHSTKLLDQQLQIIFPDSFIALKKTEVQSQFKNSCRK